MNRRISADRPWGERVEIRLRPYDPGLRLSELVVVASTPRPASANRSAASASFTPRRSLRQEVDGGCHIDPGGAGGRAKKISEKPSSMQPASFGQSGTAATSAVMVTQARSAVETRDTLSAAPDGGETA